MFDFKRASKEDLKREWKRIAEESGDDMFFTKKELAHLPDVLMDMEQVLAFSSGLMDNNTWLIALTDRRILFLDKGLLFGFKQTTIPLSKISAVTGETGMIFGTIEISEGKGARKIKNVPKKSVMIFINKVEEAMDREAH